MDGFRVDTNALRDIDEYRSARRLLDDACQRLRTARQSLSTQEFPGAAEIAELLSSAIGATGGAAAEVREMELQCREIADVYDRTERKVAEMVDLLPLPIFSSTATVSANYKADDFILRLENFKAKESRVDSPLKPAAPVLFRGNRLPCEDWLLNRAIKTAFEVQNEKNL